MNRRQFLYLVIALVVLGGTGLGLIWQDIADYRASGAKIGAKLLPDFRIAERSGGSSVPSCCPPVFSISCS